MPTPSIYRSPIHYVANGQDFFLQAQEVNDGTADIVQGTYIVGTGPNFYQADVGIYGNQFFSLIDPNSGMKQAVDAIGRAASQDSNVADLLERIFKKLELICEIISDH